MLGFVFRLNLLDWSMFISFMHTHSCFQQSTVARVATCYECELHTYFTFNALFMPLRWARHYHIKRLLFSLWTNRNRKGLLTLAQFSSRCYCKWHSLLSGGWLCLGCNGVTRANMNTAQWWENRTRVALLDLVCSSQVTSCWTWMWMIFCGFADCDLIAA